MRGDINFKGSDSSDLLSIFYSVAISKPSIPRVGETTVTGKYTALHEWNITAFKSDNQCPCGMRQSGTRNGQFQCLANFLLKHEKQRPSLQLKRACQKW